MTGAACLESFLANEGMEPTNETHKWYPPPVTDSF